MSERKTREATTVEEEERVRSEGEVEDMERSEDVGIEDTPLYRVGHDPADGTPAGYIPKEYPKTGPHHTQTGRSERYRKKYFKMHKRGPEKGTPKYRVGLDGVKRPLTKRPGVLKTFIHPMMVTGRQTIAAAVGKRPITAFDEDIPGPDTDLYPFDPVVSRVDSPSIYRGMHGIVWELCVGCALCSRVCPNDCITMEPIPEGDFGELDLKNSYRSATHTKKKVYHKPMVNTGRCIFCGFCEEFCPSGAYTLYDKVELADYDREGLIYSAKGLRYDPAMEPGDDDFNSDGYRNFHAHVDTSGEVPVFKTTDPEVPLENKMHEFPVLHPDACISCSKCANECPTSAIEMIVVGKNEKGRPIKHPKTDPEICVGCGTCSSACPKSTLIMVGEGEMAAVGGSPEDLDADEVRTIAGSVHNALMNQKKTIGKLPPQVEHMKPLVGFAYPILVEDKCTGCGDCAPVCPVRCIDMGKIPGRKNDAGRPLMGPIIDYYECIECEKCVGACPEDALYLKQWGWN